MSPPREETIIIDGYNLLLRAFRYLTEEHGLPGARGMLEVRLREYLRSRGPGLRILLVYDGAMGVGGPPASPSDPALRVVFTIPPRTADDAVVEESGRLLRGRREPLTVVTSDRKDIASRLRSLDLRLLSSEEFAEEMDLAMGDSRRRSTGGRPSGGPAGAPAEGPPEEKPSPEDLSPGEVEEWMRIFKIDDQKRR